MSILSRLKSKLLNRRPYMFKLYNWSKSGTTAYCSKEQFEEVFAGYNVVYDLDKGIVYAPFHVGETTVMVIRDDKHEQKK